MKISLSRGLVFTLLLLVWSVYGITVTTSHVTSKRELLNHAHEIMQNVTSFALQRSEDYLAKARTAEQLTHRLLTADLFEPEKKDDLEHYFFQQLRTFPDFAGIYYASPEGDFLYVSRAGEGAGGGYLTKIIDRDRTTTTRLVWRDETFAPVTQETVNDTYDPRTRPWYQNARTQQSTVWNDPYIFYTSRNPGITVSGGVRDDGGNLIGVVAVDIEITALSTFLQKLKIGKHGRAFILSPRGDVVAFHDIDAIRREDGEGGYRLVKIHEIGDPVSVEAFNAIGLQQAEVGRIAIPSPVSYGFEWDGKRYMAMLTPFADPKLAWFFGVYIPEDDYVGAIRASMKRNNYLMLILSLAATLLGLALAWSIEKPISRLAEEAEMLMSHSFEGDVSIRTLYREIHRTGEAFDKMKKSLRSYERASKALQQRLRQSHLDTILRLAACAEYKDQDTAEHLRRISRYSAILAKGLGLPPEQVELIRYASPMHDVGKIGIPDNVLMKPGRYNAEERAVMDEHPRIGTRILAPHDSRLLRCSRDVALGHHEHWDGSGYPESQSGEDIPVAARIVAVADVFDALLEKRCYKDAMPFEKAVEIVREGRGTHFDPACVDAFIEHLDEIREVRKPHEG